MLDISAMILELVEMSSSESFTKTAILYEWLLDKRTKPISLQAICCPWEL